MVSVLLPGHVQTSEEGRQSSDMMNDYYYYGTVQDGTVDALYLVRDYTYGFMWLRIVARFQ